MSQSSETHPTPPPPESWTAARQLALRVVQPIERFLHVEASSGLILLGAALIALGWANSPWAESYDHLWHTPIGIGVGNWIFEESLHFWINDLLMAIFFLVVGLEIKREIVEGALSDLRRAALPIAAAAGGMLVPAAIYLAFNFDSVARHGWGVPMATDIAFAVGVFVLLGKRVPAALRVLLLAVAIIDDIGAIMVIAAFYSAGLNVGALVYVGAGILGLFALHRLGVRPGFMYVFPGLVLWGGMHSFGVHPTIAGVIMGLMTPVKPWYGTAGFIRVAEEALRDFKDVSERPEHTESELTEPLDRIHLARREAISPAKRLEHALHPWVAFGIMPLFALANAGVNLGGADWLMPTSTTVFVGVLLGLVVGKPLGVVALSWISVRLGLCTLPPGVNWRGITVVGLVAGIGFTMALFIAELAFTSGDGSLEIAKLGILAGTFAAGALGMLAGRFWLRGEADASYAHLTASDVEASTVYWTTGGGR